MSPGGSEEASGAGDVRWLTPDEVRTLHDEVLMPGNLVGEDGARPIESVLARVEQRVHYGELLLDVLRIAAAYVVTIARAHAFVDGNKRTAITAADVFLMLNGHELVGLDAEAEEFARFMEGIAAGDVDEDALHDRLERHTRPVDDDPPPVSPCRRRLRWLMDHERLLSTEELVRLMPDCVPAGGNASRSLQRLRNRDELLGVRLMRDWRYPACQLDARGEVHAALPPVLAEARRRGYTAWEVLFWLAAPGAPVAVPVVAGRPLEPVNEPETVEDIARRAVALHEDDSPAPALVRPASLLAAGEAEAFRRLAARWLGEPAPTATSV